MIKPRPADAVDVQIAVGSPTYATLVENMHATSDPATLDWWLDLGDLLGGRQGWRCELTTNGLMWSFGPLGSSLFNVTEPDEPIDYAERRYSIYDSQADAEVAAEGIEALRTWLESNESRHADHLTKMRPLMEAYDWGVFISHTLTVRVSHDGSTWIGTIPNLLPTEAAFAADLQSLMAAVREMIQAGVDAPDSVMPRVELKAALDESATRALGLPTSP